MFNEEQGCKKTFQLPCTMVTKEQALLKKQYFKNMLMQLHNW